MKAPTILKNFLLRPRALAAVAPLPETTRFDQELVEELDALGCEIGLVQLLDAAITTQKTALDSLVNISYRDVSDREDVDKYLEDNVEILDPTSSSWLRLLEASVEEKKLQKNRSSLLQETVDVTRELKEQIKGEKEIKSCVERLKRSCKEMEDVVEVVEERVKDLYKCLIDVRMTLLGILSQH
ncbi:hypothetical protein TSUD_27620 [Trifolium subterraneum]|uniref:Uncharacterized protein n=1 Tax=Trifolium subterraneum TaxID=3900 RepID=A0A2Z6NNF7_TRISU|nr:hypothetical protein TSUD_27620 [Trifolium subterraneum]